MINSFLNSPNINREYQSLLLRSDLYTYNTKFQKRIKKTMNLFKSYVVTNDLCNVAGPKIFN